MSEVTDALDALAAGERTIEDVEQFFRSRTWPLRGEPVAASYEDAARAEERDPAVPEEGSFAEVGDAYTAGTISHDQYVRLAQAATEAMQQSGTGDETP